MLVFIFKNFVRFFFFRLFVMALLPSLVLTVTAHRPSLPLTRPTPSPVANTDALYGDEASLHSFSLSKFSPPKIQAPNSQCLYLAHRATDSPSGARCSLAHSPQQDHLGAHGCVSVYRLILPYFCLLCSSLPVEGAQKMCFCLCLFYLWFTCLCVCPILQAP